MKFSKESKTLTWVYTITVLLWVVFIIATRNQGTYEGPFFHFILKPFLVGMMIIPLLGGVLGLKKAKDWGGWKSVMGKAMTSLSLGMITWAGGMVIWNYYLFFTNVEVPYPSMADASFILSWVFWPYGVYQLSKATGAKFGLRSKGGKILLPIVLFFAVILSYYLQVVIARGGEIDLAVGGLQLFFDLFYPIGDVLIFSIVTSVYMLSRNYLGGRYRFPVLLLFVGFVSNYLSDVIFTYTTTIETYFNGHFVDFLYTSAMYVLSMGLANMGSSVQD